MYEHPGLAATLGPKGRTYVEARFDYDRLTAVLGTPIATLLDEQGPESDPDRENTNTVAASPLYQVACSDARELLITGRRMEFVWKPQPPQSGEKKV